MPTCLKCNIKFGNRYLLDGKYYNLQKRKYCINCSPFKKHNTRQIHTQPIKQNEVKICERCDKEYIYIRAKGHTLKHCSSCVTTLRRYKRKKEWVDYKGGGCCICGYNKCLQALDFHHINPDKKKFGISNSYMKSDKDIYNELDKTVCICNRCHMEYHAGLIQIN